MIKARAGLLKSRRLESHPAGRPCMPRAMGHETSLVLSRSHKPRQKGSAQHMSPHLLSSFGWVQSRNWIGTCIHRLSALAPLVRRRDESGGASNVRVSP